MAAGRVSTIRAAVNLQSEPIQLPGQQPSEHRLGLRPVSRVLWQRRSDSERPAGTAAEPD